MFKKYFVFGLLLFVSNSVNAQVGFYDYGNSGNYNNESASSNQNKNEDYSQNQEMKFEQIISKEIRERIRPDASYVFGEPDEVMCFSIERKSPRQRTATLDGYKHKGNCGSINEEGLARIQEIFFKAESFDMGVTKITNCTISPKVLLRFRKNYDFGDILLAGDNCPAIVFVYGGDTKEFYGKPIRDKINEFIEVVNSNVDDLKLGNDKEKEAMFKARTIEEDATEKEEAPKKKAWGRRFDSARPVE
ncbi:MAG: hypothetical protein MJ247_06795 [Alphaproteobacteria bacterium]|nr:hypothetical protein [Alphaproteobacteria bacterium]